MPHVIQPLMFNTVDGKKPAPVGKFSPEDFLYTRYWMLSQQDIYYTIWPFSMRFVLPEICILGRSQYSYVCLWQVCPKIMDAKCLIYFQGGPLPKIDGFHWGYFTPK